MDFDQLWSFRIHSTAPFFHAEKMLRWERDVYKRQLRCRQIVRELGEITNLRGCGIKACQGDKGCLRIEAVLPARIISGCVSKCGGGQKKIYKLL